MSAILLHLSDIHIEKANDWILDKADKIAGATFGHLPGASTVLIVVSGDIANTGSADEYVFASNFFTALGNAILEEAPTVSVHFVFAPGNHDCDFSKPSSVRSILLEQLRTHPQAKIADDVIDSLCSVQKEYRAFVSKMESKHVTRIGDELCSGYRFTVEGQEWTFLILNVAWCSLMREKYGELVFPVAHFEKLCKAPADLRIAVLHHPPNWQGQESLHPLKKALRTHSNFIVTGHEHVGSTGETWAMDTGRSAFLEGSALQDRKAPETSSFGVIELRVSESAYKSTHYKWAGDKYLRTEEGSWSDYRSMPVKSNGHIELTPRFEEILADAGANFRGSLGSPVRLQDVYIFPDLVEAHSEAKISETFNTSLLRDDTRLTGGILLSGEEKVGTTSLLYMLFLHYHERGLVPVYLRGNDIKNLSRTSLGRAVEAAVAEQYGEAFVETYRQTKKVQKILLFDDLDESPAKSEQHHSALVDQVATMFDRFILTVGEFFEFRNAVKRSSTISSIKEFKIRPFGYALRAQLVKKWVQRTSGDGSVSEADLLVRCDQGERALDTVLARNIVPSLPLYLLTILQTLDAAASGSFEDSSLSEYYEFLIREGLKTAHVQKLQWNQIIEYCSHLAWFFSTEKEKELPLSRLRSFNEVYSKDEVTVDLNERLQTLVSARILACRGNCYSFRYPYVYYFMKGRYLAPRLTTQEIANHVRDCFEHLYVRENAHTVLFLAHSAVDRGIFLEWVIEAINRPFGEKKPIQLTSEDTEAIEKLVRELPELKYSGETPEKVRERQHVQRDTMENQGQGDGLADAKGEYAGDSFIAQLVSLFKNVEILGQILKNQMASVNRAKRVELLQLLLKGQLRSVSAFYDVLLAGSDALQSALDHALAKLNSKATPEEREQVARRIIAQIVEYVAVSAVMKAVRSISSQDLLGDVDTAAQNIGSPAAKLIALGVRLDLPMVLPRQEIERTLKEVEGKFIADRVLRRLVLGRLYMFRTAEQDLQWVHSKKILDISTQRAVQHKLRKQVKLKGPR